MLLGGILKLVEAIDSHVWPLWQSVKLRKRLDSLEQSSDHVQRLWAPKIVEYEYRGTLSVQDFETEDMMLKPRNLHTPS